MAERDLNKFNQKLLALRDDLLAGGSLSVKIDPDTGRNEILDDDLKPLTEMNQVISSNRNRNRAVLLGRIEAALACLKNKPGDYGICQDCGDPILSRRLELMPYAEFCASCQQAKDNANKPTGRKHLTDYK